MKKETNRLTGRFFRILGVCLLVAAAVTLLFWQRSIRVSKEKAEGFVHTIRSQIATPRGAVLEERRDNTMSVLSVDGVDFIGLLELPRYGAAFPVGADWGSSGKYPCRLSGSLYDRSLQIGATSQKGQYDFYREISPGDGVFFTDMEGNRFAFQVTDIRYEKNADQAALQREENDLTLFIKNVYGLEYIVVFCKAM